MMRGAPNLLLVSALFLALGGCDLYAENEPAARVDLEAVPTQVDSEATPAPTGPDACEPREFEGARFTVCTADPARHTITTALAPEERAPYRSFASYRADHGEDRIAFAMNGGMFDDSGRPIGYYVESGRRSHELNRADGPGNFHLKPNGVFFGTGSTWQVLSADRFYSEVADRPDFGTQSGPMLVVDGRIHPEITENGPSRLTRNAVGVDADGVAHFVISEGPVSFGVLARLFLEELATPNALFLDGTVSSLWNPAAERMDGIAPLGPLIVVSNRPTEAE